MALVCPHCGTPLTATGPQTCPQCGQGVAAEPARSAARDQVFASDWRGDDLSAPVGQAKPAPKPEDALPLLTQGQTHLARRAFVPAVAALTRALEIDPRLAVAYDCRD